MKTERASHSPPSAQPLFLLCLPPVSSIFPITTIRQDLRSAFPVYFLHPISYNRCAAESGGREKGRNLSSMNICVPEANYVLSVFTFHWPKGGVDNSFSVMHKLMISFYRFFFLILMWTTFKSLLNLLPYCFCLMFFIFWPQGMWDVSSLTRDRTYTPSFRR